MSVEHQELSGVVRVQAVKFAGRGIRELLLGLYRRPERVTTGGKLRQCRVCGGAARLSHPAAVLPFTQLIDLVDHRFASDSGFSRVLAYLPGSDFQPAGVNGVHP
ncbi:Uncharacterised protein [Mycobacteroides abscessus subsp. abscessus]|nr:Uncharacterised protein [Mycobacteroides abscessus subsp. abscessus]